MTALDILYLQLLISGLPNLQNAVYSHDRDWVIQEIEMLHNIPSLINEPNPRRHEYYWFKERIRYIDFVESSGSGDAAPTMRAIYMPIWSKMEPLILELIR